MKRPQRGHEVLYLTQQDVIDVGLTGREILQLVRVALTEHGQKRYEMPAKIGVHPVKDTFFHAMPAWVPGACAVGIKWGGCYPENYQHGLPQTNGLMIMSCPDTGWPLCILDAIWITAKRTAAVTGLACEALARHDTAVAGVAGAGVQGREHVLVLPSVLPKLRKIKVFDKFPELAQKLVTELQCRVPSVELMVAKDLEELVRGSQVVVTATVIRTKPDPPILDSWVEPGAFLAPVDFDSMWNWETFARADKFLVDSLDEMKYFMTIGYLEHGLPSLHAEIGEVVAGVKPGRERDDELIIDMNIGMGVEDVVVGRELLTRALKKGIGKVLPL